jgi:L-malate glycosyltransferase
VPPAAELPIPIAIVLPSFEPGGSERQMTELIRRLDRRRFRVHVACFRRAGAWLPRVEEAAAEVAQFHLRSFASPANLLTSLRDFARWLREREIQIVQATDLPSNLFALPGAALAQVPVRIGSRRELAPPDKTRTHLAAQRFAYYAAHRVVANSRAGAERLRSERIPPSKIVVIPNGIDLARYSPGRMCPGSNVVTIVANLRPEKGHDVLLRAAALVRQQVPGVRFRIVGDGVLRDSLAAQAVHLDVADVVEFLGHREDVPHLLASSDAFAFPSYTEAFPNGLIEGMAAGLPVVTTAVGGMLELVEDRVNGLLVQPGDATQLAASLVEVLRNPELAERLGQAARQTIAARYSFDRMVSSFTSLYLSELAVRAPHRAPVRELLAS